MISNIVNYSHRRFLRYSFEMPSRCVRDAFETPIVRFVIILQYIRTTFSSICKLRVGPLFLRSSFALPSLFLRCNNNEKVEGQWSYSKGITKRLPTKKIFFKNCTTSSQIRPNILIIKRLIVWRTFWVRHTFVTLRHADSKHLQIYVDGIVILCVVINVLKKYLLNLRIICGN